MMGNDEHKGKLIVPTINSPINEARFATPKVVELLRQAMPLQLDFAWVNDVQPTRLKQQWKQENQWSSFFIGLLGVLFGSFGTISMVVALTAFQSNHLMMGLVAFSLAILAFVFLWLIWRTYRTSGTPFYTKEQIEYIDLYGLCEGIIYHVFYNMETQESIVKKIYLFEITQVKPLELGIYIETAKQSWTIPTQQPVVLYELINQAKNESL